MPIPYKYTIDDLSHDEERDLALKLGRAVIASLKTWNITLCEMEILIQNPLVQDLLSNLSKEIDID